MGPRELCRPVKAQTCPAAGGKMLGSCFLLSGFSTGRDQHRQNQITCESLSQNPKPRLILVQVSPESGRPMRSLEETAFEPRYIRREIPGSQKMKSLAHDRTATCIRPHDCSGRSFRHSLRGKKYLEFPLPTGITIAHGLCYPRLDFLTSA